METASLVNIIYGGIKAPEAIEVGLGVTYCGWTDRTPYHVSEVISKAKIKVVPANYKVTSGYQYDGSAKYEITAGTEEENGSVVLTRRSNGKWAPEGSPSQKRGGWVLGICERWYDPCF